ncbi:MAG: penicillin-binding protein 2 [Lentisphaeria bacterium]|nr:penicillin-binding protein 2 [Lentisphaeria bacterium]
MKESPPLTGYRSIGIRIKGIFVLFCLMFLVLIFHLYHVQIRRHKELFTKAKARYTTTIATEGTRGEIYDYDGNLLVANQPLGMISADPSIFTKEKEREQTARFLASELDLPYKTVWKKLKPRKVIIRDKKGNKHLVDLRYVLLKRDVPFEKTEQLRKKIREQHFRGITCKNVLRRTYPKNEMLSNILGVTRTERDRIQASSGLEKTFNTDMRSDTGLKTYEQTRDGIPLHNGLISSKREHDGSDLFLTIREPIQAIVEEEIDLMMARTQSKRGYIVMADPHTGNILALAQRPTFNPNDRKTLIEANSRNPVAEMAFEPGSIMKPFPVAGALDLGLVRPETRIDCEGGKWFYAGHSLKDSGHKYGILSVAEIIQKSSNIGTAKIALEIGEPRLKNILSSFGFGQKSGMPVKPETVGIFYKRVSKISITRFPIGQGISATALQMVRAYCILANGGYQIKLRFVDRIRDPRTGKVEKTPVHRGKNIFRRAMTQPEIVAMMKKVTEPGGTSTEAAVRGYHVAGKTGTAQKFIDGAYSRTIYTSSFAGFVPADNPRFVMIVTCDEPQGKNRYGGHVAGPTFSRIAERTLKYMHVPPDIPYEIYDQRMKRMRAEYWKARNEEARREKERSRERKIQPRNRKKYAVRNGSSPEKTQ